MPQIIKCPNCGANMTVNQRAGKAVCEYCDSVVLLDKEKVSDVIKARFEIEKERRQAALEREEARAEQEHRRQMEKMESIKGFIPFARMSSTGHVIKIPFLSNIYSYTSMHVNAIVGELRSLGFTNINPVPLYDLRRGLFGGIPEQNEKVAKITANGRPIMPLQTLPADANIVVSFHCLKK